MNREWSLGWNFFFIARLNFPVVVSQPEMDELGSLLSSRALSLDQGKSLDTCQALHVWKTFI